MSGVTVDGYREVERTQLVDDVGTTLSILVETNGVAWRVLAEVRKDGSISRSSFWVYARLNTAKDGAKEKVAEALGMGWRKKYEEPKQKPSAESGL